MKWSWRREALLFLPVVAMFVASIVAWPFADDSIPVHWNASGDVDRYGGKFEGLMLLPLIAVGLWALLAVLPRFDPGRANYASFAGTYTTVRAAVLVFLGGLHGLLIATALGAEIDIARVIVIAVGVLFVLLGNLLGKFRPNYFAGIRTPWTLSSARSWTATHRVGGRVFIAGGLGFIAMGIVMQPWLLIATLVAFFGGVAWLFFYSYRVWRDDPDRVPVGQARPAERPH
jgi:uncharacterized membrane protein